MNVTNMREKQLNMRLSDEESGRFEAIAKHHGLNISGVIRMLMKREEDRVATENKRKRWEEPLVDEDPELFKRVLRAYFARHGEVAAQPARGDTTIDSTGLIVLRNVNGELARYRVRGEKLVYIQPTSKGGV